MHSCQGVLSVRVLPWVVMVIGLSFQTACAVETIVHGLDEREANQIIEIFADHEISTTKGMLDNGRVVSYTLAVPAKSRIDAIKLLNKYELPRRHDKGYNEIFQAGGLIPTSGEEKAKKLAAIEGEIERQLKLIEGILDVQVQLVMPDESALQTTQETSTITTASVTIKYLPGPAASKPLSETQVQAIVAAGVEKLTPDNVVVVMTPVGGLNRASLAQSEVYATGLKKLSSGRLNTLVAALVFLLLLLGMGVVFLQLRFQTVRSRLGRLQTEITKAKRRTENTSSITNTGTSTNTDA